MNKEDDSIQKTLSDADAALGHINMGENKGPVSFFIRPLLMKTLLDTWENNESIHEPSHPYLEEYAEFESEEMRRGTTTMHVEEGMVVEGQFKGHPVETVFKDGQIVEMSIMPMRTGGKSNALSMLNNNITVAEWQKKRLVKTRRRRENRHSSPAEVQRKKRREKRAQRRKSR